MISVFQVFKIILGIIISSFILFFLLKFAGSYTEIGESSRQVSILVNFKKSVEDVYTTGIASDFKGEDLKILGYTPPTILTEVSNLNMEPVPLLIVPDEELLIYRNEFEGEWWKFYFVEAVPEMKIIFVPLGGERVWPVIGNITKLLPSTENMNIKVRFGLGCNGSEFFFGWEGYRFLESILPNARVSGIEFSTCGNGDYFRNEDYTVITVSEDFTDADFLVVPMENGMGHVYIKDGYEYNDYVYRNYLDIVALLLGGRKYYDYIGKKFTDELKVAVDIGIREAGLLRGDTNIRKRCGSELSKFTATLSLIRDMIEESDLKKEDNAREFARHLEESVEAYKTLERLGCG